jgi:hemerythrin-like domain-containing protein
MTAATRILRDEHLALTSILYALRRGVRHSDDGAPADIRLLHALIDYIVEFPERLHHPKESQVLFKLLARRAPAADALVAELEREHDRGARMIDAVTASLRRYGAGDPSELPRLARTVDAYAQFHAQHMSKEEDRLLPIAERALTAGDWVAIAEAFREGDKPAFGIGPKEQLELLYRRVLALWTPSAARSTAG